MANNSFYEDALKSVRLGFEEEKSTNTSQERFQDFYTDKHTKTKMSLASLSISKYDRNDGMESAENSFSSTDPLLDRQKRLQQLSKPMDRNTWKVTLQLWTMKRYMEESSNPFRSLW